MKATIKGHNLHAILEELRAFCRLHGLRLTVSEAPGHPPGRPKRHISVEKVYDAFTRHGSVRAAARELDIPPGTVWDRLHDAGLVPKQSKNP